MIVKGIYFFIFVIQVLCNSFQKPVTFADCDSLYEFDPKILNLPKLSMHRENPKPFQDPNVNLYKLKENEKSVIIYPKHRQSC